MKFFPGCRHHEQALRQHQGRSRGKARRRQSLHELRPGRIEFGSEMQQLVNLVSFQQNIFLHLLNESTFQI